MRGLLEPGWLQPIKYDAVLQAVLRAEAAAERGGGLDGPLDPWTLERGGGLDGPLDVAASSRTLLQSARAELIREACERLTKQLHPDWFQAVDLSKLVLAARYM